MPNIHWILRGRIAFPCDDWREWAIWFETADRTVARTDLDTEVSVSTVFLGIDHNFSGKGDPVLFETMVFGEEKISRGLGRPFSYREDLGQWRYSTWEEAERGHEEVCQHMRAMLAEAQAMVYATLVRARGRRGKMSLVPIGKSEVAHYGRSVRWVVGIGYCVDRRCVKRRIRKSVRRAQAFMSNENISSRKATRRMLRLAMKSPRAEST